ncbi:MAG: hypothetical protein P1U89_20380 [Verrucomicrobiales bacterium]|nr:hypothetical protein [Verrucomicrobiales bacterium]
MEPQLFSYRPTNDNRNAVVFIHGFSGNYLDTWGNFPWILASDLSLQDYDFWSLGYPTSRKFDMVFWEADPRLDELTDYLGSRFTKGELSDYESVSLVCHSMGGLLARRMILKYPKIESKLKSLTMFGTPNNGLKKASFISKLKAQVSDMVPDSQFICSLNNEWSERYSNGETPFSLLSITGLSDDFVPKENSHFSGFCDDPIFVQGNHLSMVKPATHNCESVKIFKNVLEQDMTLQQAQVRQMSIADEALTTDHFEFEISQITGKEPDFVKRVVKLALEIEAAGHSERALQFLKEWKSHHTDIQGTYAGRLKRRWQVFNDINDAIEALDNYKQALEISLTNDDADQVYYHAINVAFMYFVTRLSGLDESLEQAQIYARQANEYSRKTDTNYWNMATLAESYLYFEQTEEAITCYKMALSQKPKADQRMLESTGQQAYFIVEEFAKRGRSLEGFINRLVDLSADRIKSA